MKSEVRRKIVLNTLIVLGLTCCLVSVLFPAVVYSACAFMRANVYFPQDMVNMGLIPTNAKKSFAIQMMNNHPSRLHILKVTTSCGCTVAATDTMTIPPFGTATIRGYVAPPVEGKAVRSVTVITDKGASSMHLAYEATTPSDPRNQ